MNYVYIQSEPNLWTAGFYMPDGKWISESDHFSGESAAAQVHYLNGGGLPDEEPTKAELLEALEDAVADLAPTPKEDCGCESGKCSRCCNCFGCAAIRADDVSENLKTITAKATKS